MWFGNITVMLKLTGKVENVCNIVNRTVYDEMIFVVLLWPLSKLSQV